MRLNVRGKERREQIKNFFGARFTHFYHKDGHCKGFIKWECAICMHEMEEFNAVVRGFKELSKRCNDLDEKRI